MFTIKKSWIMKVINKRHQLKGVLIPARNFCNVDNRIAIRYVQFAEWLYFCTTRIPNKHAQCWHCSLKVEALPKLILLEWAFCHNCNWHCPWYDWSYVLIVHCTYIFASIPVIPSLIFWVICYSFSFMLSTMFQFWRWWTTGSILADTIFVLSKPFLAIQISS